MPKGRELTAEGFVQDNISRSCRGRLRGLHFQSENIRRRSSCRPFRDGFSDVAVDVRRKSPHFGKWVGTELSDENHRQMYVPAGFAHGFCVLSESADLFYKCTDFYYPQHERTLLWNDTGVGIRWPLEFEPILSDKDCRGIPLASLECFDELAVR